MLSPQHPAELHEGCTSQGSATPLSILEINFKSKQTKTDDLPKTDFQTEGWALLALPMVDVFVHMYVQASTDLYVHIYLLMLCGHCHAQR